MKNLYITTVLLSASLAFVSCGDDDSTFAPRTDDESAEYSSADDIATSSSAKNFSSSNTIISSSSVFKEVVVSSSSDMNGNISSGRADTSKTDRSDSSSAKNFSSSNTITSSSSVFREVVVSSSSDMNGNISSGGADTSKTDRSDSYDYGSFADYRDGKVYKTVKIGNQEWMAENLNFKGSLAQETWCYENKAEFCAKYGLLYAWNAAIKACPGGWHLPDTTEWNSLILTVGGIETAGSALKSAGGWENNGNGTDAYGFNALPAGHRAVGFADEKRIAFFWSSTENIDNFAYYTAVGFEDDSTHQGPIYKELAFSVRCIKD